MGEWALKSSVRQSRGRLGQPRFFDPDRCAQEPGHPEDPQGKMMTKTRTGEAWMPADEYGRSLPKFTVNLLVRDVTKALPFYRDVLQAAVRYSDGDFAALEIGGTQFMLHADHSYDRHPLSARVKGVAVRGIGAEIRVMGIDPDAAEARARKFGAEIVQETRDFPHGWRDVMLADADGYVWAVGLPIQKL